MVMRLITRIEPVNCQTYVGFNNNFYTINTTDHVVLDKNWYGLTSCCVGSLANGNVRKRDKMGIQTSKIEVKPHIMGSY